MDGKHQAQLLFYQDDRNDITRNLPSLTFESGLDDEEQLLLHLRQQSHAHTVIACATSAFLVSILNEARQIRADLAKTTKQRRAIQLLTADSLPKDPLKVGIIGCGRLGTHLALSLLSFGDVEPADLSISTRRPETAGKLTEKGVHVEFNNKRVAQNSHFLFICVLPSQLAGLIEEIKGHLHKQSLVYCLVNNATAKKVRRTLDHPHLFLPKFVFDSTTVNSWKNCMSVHNALEDAETVRKCCPYSEEGKDSCVHLTEKWVELVVCAFVNQCTDLDMTSDAALDMLHGICFGMESIEKNTANSKFVQSDFIINWDYEDTESRKFPKFDLSKIHDNDSHVVKKLRVSPALRKCFAAKFSAVYQNYHDMRRFNTGEEDEKK